MTTTPDEQHPKVGSQMSYWIATVLKEEREQAGVSDREIATALNVDRRTVLRLEAGETMGQNIDNTVAAYAYVIGIDDARALWAHALERWMSEGTAPVFRPATNPALNFAREIRAEASRRRRADTTRARAERPGTRRATRRTTTGG